MDGGDWAVHLPLSSASSIDMSGDKNRSHDYQELYSGLIRLHILHHACEGEIFGLWMIEELGRHGYKLSAGTMYPLLHTLEERGLLVSKERRVGQRYRRVYRATSAGQKALIVAKVKVQELFGELFESRHGTKRPRSARSRA